jgi:hypothetical protein
MRDVGLVATAGADELEFPGVKYVAGVHENPAFLNGVCLAIEATLGAVASPVKKLRLRCGVHVFAQIAFADPSTGDVNVAYRIKLDAAQTQMQGQVQKVMRSPAGKVFAQKLKASSHSSVVQLLLSPAWSAEDDDASSSNVGATVGVVAGVCAICAVVAVLMVKQRRSDRAASKAAADAEHWQVASTINEQRA